MAGRIVTNRVQSAVLWVHEGGGDLHLFSRSVVSKPERVLQKQECVKSMILHVASSVTTS